MRYYDDSTGRLSAEDYATPEDACEAWASAVGGFSDRVTMLTREGDAWTRWTLCRTGMRYPSPEWAVMRSLPCNAPEGFDD